MLVPVGLYGSNAEISEAPNTLLATSKPSTTTEHVFVVEGPGVMIVGFFVFRCLLDTNLLKEV